MSVNTSALYQSTDLVEPHDLADIKVAAECKGGFSDSKSN